MANPRAFTFTIDLAGNLVTWSMELDTTSALGTKRPREHGTYAFSALANPTQVRNQLIDAMKTAAGIVGTVDT
jgi:hypothetical protein